jgi:hypothetical protein
LITVMSLVSTLFAPVIAAFHLLSVFTIDYTQPLKKEGVPF